MMGEPNRQLRAAILAAALVGLTGPVSAETGSVQKGRVFVEENCSDCHAIGGDDESALTEAPAFRTLHERYPVEFLAEALAEGIVTAHLGMPVFELEPDEIDDVIAYLKSLEN